MITNTFFAATLDSQGTRTQTEGSRTKSADTECEG